jgi:UDP-N-acetylmuramate dehydrogenase
LLNIEKDKNLQDFNTFAFDSSAEYFINIVDEEQVSQSVQFAEQKELSYQVLSGGSNLLFKERINGLTLHMQLKGRKLISEGDNHLVLRVAAGENWHELVEYSVNQGWQGLENLALIPGLVGASPVQNIGAYGVELCDCLVSLRAFDTRSKVFIEMNNAACEFAYRDSLFKRNKGRYVIVSVDLKLSKETSYCEVKYQALSDYLSANDIVNPSVKDVFDGVCAIRREKLPAPSVLANAGSFFKNPCISLSQFEQLKEQFPELVGFKVSDTQVKLAAGWLIDQCGWKGYLQEGVGVYAKQALVLVHFGGATLSELLNLAEQIKESIYKTFKVHLEIEPQLFP